jgi:copper chaperone CopZ
MEDRVVLLGGSKLEPDPAQTGEAAFKSAIEDAGYDIA